MAILTRTELEQRLPGADLAQFADMSGTGAETAGMVDAALNDAQDEVLGYVRGAVNPALLPDPAPDVLKRLVCDVARYNLLQRHVGEDHPAMIAYRNAVATLRDIASGKLGLPLAATAPAQSSASAALYAPTRSLTDTAMAGMMP